MINKKVGLEIEYRLLPNKGQIETVSKILRDKNLLTKRAKPTISRLEALLRESILGDIFTFDNKIEIELDGKNTEFIFRPRSFISFFNQRDAIAQGFEVLKSLGFTASSKETPIGIHHNIDLEDKRVFLRTIDLIFYSRKLLYEVSNREGITDSRSNIRKLIIGDPQGIVKEELLEKVYLQLRDILEEGYEKQLETSCMGLRLFPNGRNTLELMYFNSTLDIKVFTKQLVYTMSLIWFARSNRPYNQFKEYLFKKYDEYYYNLDW